MSDSIQISMAQEANEPSDTSLSFIDHSTKQICCVAPGRELTYEEHRTMLESISVTLQSVGAVYSNADEAARMYTITVSCVPMTTDVEGFRLWPSPPTTPVEPDCSNVLEPDSAPDADSMVSSLELKPAELFRHDPPERDSPSPKRHESE